MSWARWGGEASKPVRGVRRTIDVKLRSPVIVLGVVALLGACLDGRHEPVAPGIEPPAFTVNVSDPIGISAPFVESPPQAFDARADYVAYVSLAPNTIRHGLNILIRNRNTGYTRLALLSAGGLDPVAVHAATGDALELTVTDSAGAASQVTLVVSAARPPIVVRSNPPPRKRDVPLNAAIVVVFSEPMNPTTVTAQTLLLLHNGQAVAGAVTLTPDGLYATFTPDAPFGAEADYTLVVTTAVADAGGQHLEQTVVAGFSTAAAAVPVESLAVEPPVLTLAPGDTATLRVRAFDAAGYELQAPAVMWSSADPGVATVSPTGTVAGMAVGTAVVTATADSVSATATIQVQATPRRVLVDASRDGGVWWFPQWEQGGFDPNLDHQGQKLANYLRASGYVVDELPRPYGITSGLLNRYDLVIRASGFGAYSDNEIAAYQDYVQNGGNLLLLADHMLYAPLDRVALSFGIEFAGITRGENLLNDFVSHPITDRLTEERYLVGSGVIAYPATAQIIGRLSSGTYLDLNKNDLQDAGEPTAPDVLGVLTYGAGRIVFCGDVNMWEPVPQPLVDNVLAWLRGP